MGYLSARWWGFSSFRQTHLLAIQAAKLSEDAAHLLLAAAVGAADKATAVEAYSNLQEAAPDILDDRGTYTRLCVNCKVELRVQHWQVSLTTNVVSRPIRPADADQATCC